MAKPRGTGSSATEESECATAAERIAAALGQGRTVTGGHIRADAAKRPSPERAAECGAESGSRRKHRRETVAEFRARGSAHSGAPVERDRARRSQCQSEYHADRHGAGTRTAVAITERRRSHRLTAAASDNLNVATAGAVKHRGDERSRSLDRRVAARDRRTGVARRRNRR